MRNSVSTLIGKFARASLGSGKLHLHKSTKRRLKREWNRCGQHQRFEMRKKMENAL